MQRTLHTFLKIAVSVGIVLVCVGAITFVLGRRTAALLYEARGHIARAEQALTVQRDFKTTTEELAAAEIGFNRAAKALAPLGYLRAVPWISRNYKALAAGTRAAALATGAIGKTAHASGAVTAPFHGQGNVALGDLPKQERAEALAALAASLPDLRAATHDLARASDTLARAPKAGLLAPLKDALDELEGKVAVARGALEDGIPLIEVAPSLLGYPEPKTYLFILQNSDELRPTGGFIGTYGLLTFEAGHITSFATDDVYNLDRFAPPASRPFSPSPLRTYLHQPRFYLRDANFDPDFPQSARTILQFYGEEQRERCRREAKSMPHASCLMPPVQLDGVIAVMPETLRSLLELTGPITVSGQTFTTDNLTDALEYEVEIGFAQKGIPRPQRKEIVSELGHALIAKIMALPALKWPEVLHRVRTALDEKQMLVWSADSDLETFITLDGWGGALEEAPADYLAVFDANMFALKTDPYVTRTIFYRVKREAYGPAGEVEIVYSYPKAGPAWKTKGYRSFVRVYVPKGSVLQSAAGAMKEEGSSEPGEVEVSQESGKTVFGAFVALQVGQVKRVRFTYRLPDYVGAAVDQGAYDLTVQKQPGTLGHSLTVTADFGKVPKLWSPTGLSAGREGSTMRWQTSLRQDQEFEVSF